MESIYFDYASTTPTDPEVIKAMHPFFHEQFGNVSSSHAIGRGAKKALEEARETIARFIGAQPHEIVFNSGGTESNNHAIFGTARSLKSRGNHIIISGIEHHSVFTPMEYLEKEGLEITYLKVDQYGLVNPEDVRAAITDKTILISVMYASNEIGTIQPVAQIGKIAKEKGIPFLVDAVQAVGHIPVDVNEINCDLLSLSAHKFYGPKGVGALYIRKGTKLTSFLLGGDQELGRRASTQNVSGIVGMAKAIEISQAEMKQEQKQQSALRDRLITQMRKKIDGVILNGHPKNRLPNNAHFSFPGIDGEALLTSLDMGGIAASQGSACTSGALEPSHVLGAIGLSDQQALGALRITIGRWTTKEHVDYLVSQLTEIVGRLQV